jgi:predicted O-linked N-acetylglucosamine transferase (SPINDLY family)
MAKSPAVLLNEAVALHQAGRLADAAARYRAILTRAPQHAEALHLLGLVKIASGDLAGGVASIRRAIAVQPGNPLFHANLGLAFLRAAQPADAVPSLRQAVALDPATPTLHDQLAGALALSGEIAAALEALRQAQGRFPRDPQFPVRLSALLIQTGDLAGARLAAEAALAVAPRHVDALVNRGLVEVAAEDLDAALGYFETALKIAPMSVVAQNNLSSAASKLCDFDRLERLTPLIERRVLSGAANDGWETLTHVAYLCPYLKLAPAVQRRTVDEIAARFPRVAALPPVPPRPHGRVLRVGYVSAGFGNYAIGHVARTLFGNHDRSRFRIYGYALRDRSGEDHPFHRAIREGCDEWRGLDQLADDEAAALIRADEIDILIDVCGYLEGHRPAIFAHRPAPVQVYWLAHAGGLGLPFIDYLIADRIVVPPGEERLYRENLVRLPDTYHCADGLPFDAEAPDAAAEGLAGASFVFCAFNNPQKIDRTIFLAWMRILAAVPGSVLWLSDPSGIPAMQRNLRAHAEAAGIAGERIVFARYVQSKPAHLVRHALAGLFLDTMTVNAATTTLDALWAGLPVLTLRGKWFAARMAHTMVNALELADALVAEDLVEYEARAIALARDPAALAALAGRVRQAVRSKALFDTARFCRNLERAFLAMAERHDRGMLPAPFDFAPA